MKLEQRDSSEKEETPSAKSPSRLGRLARVLIGALRWSIGSPLSWIFRPILGRIWRRGSTPRLRLEQSLDSMASGVKLAQDALVRACVEEKRLQKELDRCASEIKRSQTLAETSLARGDELGARRALEQRKTLEETHESKLRTLSDHQDQVRQLKAQVESMQRQLERARLRHGVLLTRVKAVEAKAAAEGSGPVEDA